MRCIFIYTAVLTLRGYVITLKILYTTKLTFKTGPTIYLKNFIRFVPTYVVFRIESIDGCMNCACE